jgi:uncharacterized protein involved in outer membrane biogenesis
MKWLFKWVWRLVFLAVVLVILLLVFRDSFWRAVTEHRIRAQTGMDASIGRFSSGLFSPVVTIENLKLYNTAEFGGTLFLDVPELHLELDPVALAQRKLRVTLARFNLAELNVVRNEAGQTNILSLLNKVTPSSTSGNDRLQKLAGDLKFEGVAVLNLSLGKVRFIDLKDATRNRELRLDLQNQIFKNVKSDADVYGMLFMIWLRTGGKFSITPADLAKDFVGRKADRIETTVRQAVGVPPAPVKK